MPIIETNALNFIKLRNQTIASYAIQYNINQCFHFHKIEQIKSTDQFYYKGLLNKEHVYELMLIDTAFAEVIGKLAQEVFLKKVKTLSEFIFLHNHYTIIKGYTDAFYYHFKFKRWLMQLFFPDENLIRNTHSKKQFSANSRSVYVQKNQEGALEYFSIYDSKKLLNLLLEKMHLRIDIKHSKIEKDMLTLVLNLEIN